MGFLTFSKTRLIPPADTPVDPARLAANEKALRDWNIKYEKLPDGTPLVRGDIDLSSKFLKALPDFSLVALTGSFSCDRNQLSSLKGVPRYVGKDFSCVLNSLCSLEYAPQHVGRHFNCGYNSLSSLKGAPQEIGGIFSCKGSFNNIPHLRDAPRKFKKLTSHFGTFKSWIDIPPNLKLQPQEPPALTAPTPVAPAQELTVAPETPAPPAPSPWQKTGESEIARVTLKEVLGYRITELFNFEAGTYTQVTQNLQTSAETQAMMELANLPAASLVATAAAELKSQGGSIPEHIKLPGLLDKPKLG